MPSVQRLTLAKVQQLKPEITTTRADGVSILIGCGLLAWGMIAAGPHLPAPARPMLEPLLYMVSLFLGVIGAGNFFEGVLRRPNPSLLDGEIVARARELGDVPEEISRRLDRALGAYSGIQRLAVDPVWQRSGIRVGDYLHEARTCMLGLLERGQPLVRVASTLERFQGEVVIPEPYVPVAEAYRNHLEQLDAATAQMEQAEASLSRALLAASTGTSGAASLDNSLREMTSHFSALAEVLEALSSSAGPDLPAVEVNVTAAQAEPDTLRAGTRG